MNYKLFFYILLLPTFLFANVDRNRENRIKNYFLEQAQDIILKLDNEGVDITQLSQGLANLKLENIEVSWESLVDNRGSLVDAIGTPNHLILDMIRLETYIREGYDLGVLVLHELHRISGIDDDSFENTINLIQFLDKDETKLAYCNLNVATTKSKRITKIMKVSASSTDGIDENRMTFNTVPGSAYNTVAKTQEMLKSNAIAICKKQGYSNYAKIFAGQIRAEQVRTNFTSRAELNISANVECVKWIAKKRKKSEINRERCLKINLCNEILKQYNIYHILNNRDLEIFQEDSRC